MTRICVFPGQGSQHPGMGKDWYENFKVAQEVFAEASDAISLDLKKLCFDGSDADLRQTSVTQPALLTVSVAIFEAIKKDQEINFSETIFAGHSLGEYSALVCAGALPLAEAVKIVRKRGELMQSAVPEGLGGMAALIFKPGTAGETIAVELCEKAATQSQKTLSVANFNSPEQIVISGHKAALEVVEAMLKTENLGIRKLVPLNVSAPFHCSLMRPAADALKEDLVSAHWKNFSNIEYIPNTMGLCVSLRNAKECALRLYEQVSGSVLWSQSMRHALSKGITEHLEIGPGSVLSSLMKRISALSEIGELKINNTSTFELYRERS